MADDLKHQADLQAVSPFAHRLFISITLEAAYIKTTLTAASWEVEWPLLNSSNY